MVSIDEAISALRDISMTGADEALPPTVEQVAAAEAALGFKFPASFLRFMEIAGSYRLPFWETYWVGSGNRCDIVDINMSERTEASSPLPSYLIAFFNNGAGDQLCFDTRTVDEHGEYPIVFWDHELSQDENLSELTVFANNFAQWLMDEVEAEEEE